MEQREQKLLKRTIGSFFQLGHKEIDSLKGNVNSKHGQEATSTIMHKIALTLNMVLK